jgi:hypothetical protein
MANEERNEVNRREFLRKAAITGAVAWAIPVVQSVAATPAYAFHNGTPHPCPHSTPDIPEQSCMGTCKVVCGTGTGCSAQCQPQCSAGLCDPNTCDQRCWRDNPAVAGCQPEYICG